MSNKIKENKVRLRLYREKDFEFLHGLLSDEVTKKYFPFMYTMEREQTFIRLRTRLEDQAWGIDTRYVIEDMRRKVPVGEVSGRKAKDDPSCMELAVLVHPDFRGQNFARDCVFEFIKKMRETKPEITKFRMEIAESNKASQAVARKLNFKLKGDKEIGTIRKGTYQYWEDK